jgi:pimeloyl-ACP methyl ester carboxylesterase
VRVDEHTIELASSPVFFRQASGPNPGPAEPLYLHGLPTSSDDWVGLLERTGGLAPDLPGFGRSGKGGQLDLTFTGHAVFVTALLGALGVERVQLVAHDWGTGAALAFALDHPQRIERMVLINPVPLHQHELQSRLARIWRTPVLGELAMGFVTRRRLARWLRSGTTSPETVWPPTRTTAVWSQFDQGTQRAILRLHRAATPPALTVLRDALTSLDVPALVLHGDADPWVPRSAAQTYAERLPGATFAPVDGAGHWPWLESEAALERITAFLERP